eukprot:scaffold7381_cov310-Pinguiococcus_pyrenoidosus.AAC.39
MGQNLGQPEIEAILSEVDANNNGKLDFAEFLTLMVRKDVEFDVVANVKTAFRTLDPSGSGVVPTEKQSIQLTKKKVIVVGLASPKVPEARNQQRGHESCSGERWGKSLSSIATSDVPLETCPSRRAPRDAPLEMRP